MGQSRHARTANAHPFSMYIADGRGSIRQISRVNADESAVGRERDAVESRGAVQLDGLPSHQRPSEQADRPARMPVREELGAPSADKLRAKLRGETVDFW